MATVVKLGGSGGPDKGQRPTPKPVEEPESLAKKQVSPLMALGIIAAVAVLVAGLWFGVNRAASGAASSPMLDTSSESQVVPPEQRANGMDSSTSSPAAATNNGMDTGTGR